jgi:DNA-binding NtrC family response regulator
MISYTIYIVDDEKTIRKGITMILKDYYTIEAFATAETAIDAMGDNPPDLVLMDIGLPGMSGIDALGKIKAIHPEVLVIMITAYEDIKSVISAMKKGAYDYVTKPIQMDSLEVNIANALETIRLRKEVYALQKRYLQENMPCFIGKSKAIHDVMDFVGMVAKSPDVPVLILGETGTGKELIASAVHYRSPNFKGPFVTMNCAAIPKDLVESELFGYTKGAFSGASPSGKQGLIESAANGTLFLDEVGDLSLEAQAKLLRFLEEGVFYKIGSTAETHVKTRVISATNRNLDRMISDESFRKDLYFRLSVIKVDIPSLNERREDIIPLAMHFLYSYGKKYKKKVTGISSNARDALMAYNWSGNVRELKNIIERGVLLCPGTELTVQNLGLEGTQMRVQMEPHKNEYRFPCIPQAGIDLPEIEKAMEIFYIEAAFKMADENETKAARLLNINHHTYRYRHKKIKDLLSNR